MEDKVFPLGNNMIVVKLKSDVIEEIDIDDALKIDYANIIGEILTFPVLLNQLGLMLAEMEDLERREDNQFLIIKEDWEEKRGMMELKAFDKLQKGIQELDIPAIKTPTKDQVSAYIKNTQAYKIEKQKIQDQIKKLLEIRKDKGYINSLYWSAKSKDDKLNKITDKLRPQEFIGEVVDGIINGITIKVHEKLIKDPIVKPTF